MQLQIWHGHNTDKSLPNKIWLDNIKTYSFTNSYLDFLYIYNSKENNRLEDIFNQNDLSAKIIGITKVNPTKYIIKIKANEPFMLAFTESYDSLWRAYENGYEHHSMPLYSVINGFWINNTGEYEITLRYKTQDFLEIGFIVTMITLIFCISFLFISWKKESKYIKKIKNKIIKSKQMKK